MSSGVIDIRYAPGLPYQTRKLVQLLRNGIVEGSINPFGGELHSQDGVVQIEGFPPLPSTQIVEMDWLADNVVGTIPQPDDEPKVRAYENPCHSRYRRAMPLGVLSQRTL